MATQVITLDLRGEGWEGAVLIDPNLIDGGADAYLRYIRDVGTSIQVQLSETADGSPDEAGLQFSAVFETAAAAFTFVAEDASSLILKGPGHADNTFADPDEPYFWTPDNGAEMQTWFNATRHSEATLTLDDGLGPIVAVRGRASAGALEATGRVDRVPALTLADFDTGGLELDVLALIRAGAGPQQTIFAAPPRGTVGALLEGELGLGARNVPITRIRRRNGTMLLINDNEPLSLADYFSAGGDGADLTLYVQTLDGMASLPVTALGRGGGNYVQFGPIGTAFDAILDGIDAGDRFIFAFARAAPLAVAVRGAAGAGWALVTARVIRVTPAVRTIQGTAVANAPDARGTVLASRVRHVGGVVAAGETVARGHVAPIRVHAIRGRAPSGSPWTRARVAVATVRAIRAKVQAGGAVAPARVRAAASTRLYERNLRESAPADRLLIALEIVHPAVAQPVRVVNDTEGRTIEGNAYVALRFDARLADDIAGQAPQAELAIDNVGRALTQWIEATGGGVGATVRVMLVLSLPDPPVEWEVTLDVAQMTVDQERVTARLGFDPLLGRNAVTLRHDPQTSPGLF